MGRPKKAFDVSETHRMCSQCRTIKELRTQFNKNKNSIKGYRSECGSCRAWGQYQRTLSDMVEAGNKQVVECLECECYMMKKTDISSCVNCRRVNGEIDNERYLNASTRKRRGSTLETQGVPVLETRSI